MRCSVIQRGGFTFLEIMVVIAIIGLLVTIAVPSFAKSREIAQRKICIENLAQIESAKQLWGLEKGKEDGDVPKVSDLIGKSLYIKDMPICPAGGSYTFGAIGEKATCTWPTHKL